MIWLIAIVTTAAAADDDAPLQQYNILNDFL